MRRRSMSSSTNRCTSGVGVTRGRSVSRTARFSLAANTGILQRLAQLARFAPERGQLAELAPELLEAARVDADPEQGAGVATRHRSAEGGHQITLPGRRALPSVGGFSPARGARAPSPATSATKLSSSRC